MASTGERTCSKKDKVQTAIGFCEAIMGSVVKEA